MKNLFLDTNIFLSFYSFGKDDLKELEKLNELIIKKEIKLYTTTQIINEFRRNREIKIAEAYKTFEDSKINIVMPAILKQYSQYRHIQRLQKLIGKKKSELAEKSLKDIREKNLQADIIICDLFSNAEEIKSDEMLHKAIVRHRLGNPPGKKDSSYGDEINWESLLEKAEDKGDFIFVSQDGDFSDPFDKKKLRKFLVDEWSVRKQHSKIFFYRTLGDFFREHDINIRLQENEEKNNLIDYLINSKSFWDTHEIIRKLSKLGSFSDEQTKALTTALLSNNQVNWISEDEDIKTFYDNLLSDKSNLFDESTWKEISDLIFDDEKDLSNEIEEIFRTTDEIEKDDIPF